MTPHQLAKAECARSARTWARTMAEQKREHVLKLESAKEQEMRAVLDGACAAFQIGQRDILSKTRGTKSVSDARQFVMYALRERGMTLTEIAAFLGRDHTTVRHGIRAFTSRLPQEARSATS